MHLQKPSSDSDRRQALGFRNEMEADEYLFFPLVPILSALIGCSGVHLETWQQSTDAPPPLLWCSGARVYAIKNVCFLNLSGSGGKLEDDW